MMLRERFNEGQSRPVGTDDSGGEPLEALRREGEGHLAAGADAIARALSGDSEAFLAANRQQGGQ